MRTLIWALVALALAAGSAAAAEDPVAADPVWGFGWSDGLTLRYCPGAWQLGLAAGPNDYLIKEERRDSIATDPQPVQGQLELPLDEREEHGWVRLRAGRELRSRGPLSLTAFVGLSYEWIDHQERTLELDPLVGDYDTFELDRFTDYWILEGGLRPSWRVNDWFSCEFSFGLRYVWEDWDQDSTSTWAGVEEPDRSASDGSGNLFQAFGWEGVSSLGFVFWL